MSIAIMTTAAESLRAAMRHHRAGRLVEAEAYYRAVIAAAPHQPQALHAFGALALQTGRHDMAAELMQRAIAAEPGVAAFHKNLATAVMTLGRFAEAEAACRRAIGLDPSFAEAHATLARALFARGLHAEAADAAAEALRLRPDYAEARNDRGSALSALGRWNEAETCFRAALRLAPGMIEAANNLGVLLRDLGRLDEAIASYRLALRHAPQHPLLHANLGMALLTAGDFAEGWAEYEWRLRPGGNNGGALDRGFAQPAWRGEAIGTRVLLLHGEQGLGDSIQFCRYVPLVAGRGAQIVLEVPQPLVRLLRSLGDFPIIALGESLPRFDLHCSLMSLPGIFTPHPAKVPGIVPYLVAEPAAIAAWRQRLAEFPGLKIGLCWAGNPRADQPELNAVDRRRSLALATLAPLAALPGIAFVSLQKGVPAAEIAASAFAGKIHDWTAMLDDFADTAALIEALDLVISVDTAVAHLAGALGKPVWLLNRFDACWRWLRGCDDSPWYPTLRQFRQPDPGDWESVVGRARDALAARAERPPASAPHI